MNGLCAALAGFLVVLTACLPPKPEPVAVEPPPAAAPFEATVEIPKSICADPAKAEALIVRQGERETAHGVTWSGILVTLYTARDGSSWTLVMREPRANLTCLLGRGGGWEPVYQPEGRS